MTKCQKKKKKFIYGTKQISEHKYKIAIKHICHHAIQVGQ